MMKRLCLALAGLFALASVAQAAGTVPGFSLTPQFDLTGKVAPGCRLYIIQAGTPSTPQNAYQDSGLTLPQPNPMLCDAAGRLSQFFVADGVIKLRLTKSNGEQIFVGDNLVVVGASGGGGGGGTVDPTTIIATGDFKLNYGTGILTGFVRCNGRTIGSSTSGATERANSDAQSLFQYFWGVDVNLAVSGGRGASANADWVANKTLTLPDCRGRTLAGLADMGNSAASWLTSTYFGSTPTTLGAVSTTTDHITLTTPNLPPYTPAGSVSVSGNVGNFQVSGSAANFTYLDAGAASKTLNFTGGSSFGLANGTQATASGTMTGSLSGTPQNGTSTPFSSVQPTILVTTYIKL